MTTSRQDLKLNACAIHLILCGVGGCRAFVN